MATYLVTGCAGFIGWKVCELLLAAGDMVVGVDDLNDAYDVRLKHWRLKRNQQCERFSFHLADITDREQLAGVAALYARKGGTLDAVINLAARAGIRQSVVDPWAYYATNVIGTLNLLELCRSQRVAKFVLASSSSVYGNSNPMPCSEDADTSHPLSPYAASKKAAEVLCHAYHSLHGLDVTILRYFTVYGPAGRPDMMPFRMVRWIVEGQPVTVYGDGLQSRDFTYVDDIARGTIAALRPLEFQIANLGSDAPAVLTDVIHLVERLVGRKAIVDHRASHPADVTGTWASIVRAEQHLGWRPLVGLEQGFAQLVAWYQNNRELASQVELA